VRNRFKNASITPTFPEFRFIFVQVRNIFTFSEIQCLCTRNAISFRLIPIIVWSFVSESEVLAEVDRSNDIEKLSFGYNDNVSYKVVHLVNGNDRVVCMSKDLGVGRSPL
jgi:hypothetical protein